MNSFNQSTHWLAESPLAPYVDAYKKYFIQESYSSETVKAYFHCIAHFAHWITQSSLDIRIKVSSSIRPEQYLLFLLTGQ